VLSAPIKSPPGSAQPSAIGNSPLPFSRYLTYFGLALAGAGLDLFSKQAMFRWRGLPRANNEWWIVEPYFGIETSVNRGALFGMGAGYWWLFASLSVLALLGILTWLFAFRAARDRWITVALGLVSGGIVGNLYDRLGLWDARGLPPEYHHGVRDWILWRYGEYTWPNFNIADSLLVTGAIMLVVHSLIWRDESQDEKPPAASGQQVKRSPRAAGPESR
jgi:signal peptidase II